MKVSFLDCMIVRIRFTRPISVWADDLALAAGSLLMPLALTSFTVALWAFLSEWQPNGSFFVVNGMFAHWQVWLGVASVLSLLARLLGRFGTRQRAEMHRGS